MDDLLAARLQMSISLGFHIVFACIGMTMPWLMAAAQYRYLRSRDPLDLSLARTWAKGVAVFFAVGAVSGTVLSLELGLLWPTFMLHAGPIFGLPFSWEGTAFFLEAIAIGLFFYGWERLPERVHFASGVMVGVLGVASGILVVSANAWMNSPAGFRWSEGRAIDIDPVAAMFNAAWPSQALHMTLAAFVSTAFAAAGVHAFMLLRHPGAEFHRRALRIALWFAAISVLLQLPSGDLSAKGAAQRQPAKFAAMEALYHSREDAPLLLGGMPDDETQSVRFGIEVPYALSLLAHGDPHARVRGLEEFPAEDRPPTRVVHLAFQIMVGLGTLLSVLGGSFLVLRWRRPAALDSKLFLRLVALATPLGFLAVEAGWVVTEVGRQPWIIYGVMRTRDAVSPMPGLVWPLIGSLIIYVLLSLVTAGVMRHLVRGAHLTAHGGGAAPIDPRAARSAGGQHG